MSEGMGTQFALSVVANLATDAAKAVYRWGHPIILEAIGRSSPAADATAEENVLELARALDERLGRGDVASVTAGEEFNEKVRQSLDDPDVVATLRSAVLTGARTSSRERHRILANLIAERLGATTDSGKAAAGNLAVTTLQHLGAEHLHVLGLLALIHVARPDFLGDVDEAEKADDAQASNADRYAKLTLHGQRFVAWLVGALDAHHVPERIDDGVLRHLTAASCILVDSSAELSLEKALRPANEFSHAYLTSKRYYGAALGRFLEFGEGGRVAGRLKHLWYQSLQHVTPTPAGMLIGLAVHDAKTDDTQCDRWEWASTNWIPGHERPRLEALVDKDFDEAVWEALERKASRIQSVGGVLPWQLYGRR